MPAVMAESPLILYLIQPFLSYWVPMVPGFRIHSARIGYFQVVMLQLLLQPAFPAIPRPAGARIQPARIAMLREIHLSC